MKHLLVLGLVRVFCVDCVARLCGVDICDAIEKCDNWACFLCASYDPQKHGPLKGRTDWRTQLALLFQPIGNYTLVCYILFSYIYFLEKGVKTLAVLWSVHLSANREREQIKSLLYLRNLLFWLCSKLCCCNLNNKYYNCVSSGLVMSPVLKPLGYN